MLKNRIHWQVMSVTDSETGHLFELFAERYSMTQVEKEALRLLVLFGFEDREIVKILQTSSYELAGQMDSIMVKTRTNSTRELHALFLRYALQKAI